MLALPVGRSAFDWLIHVFVHQCLGRRSTNRFDGHVLPCCRWQEDILISLL